MNWSEMTTPERVTALGDLIAKDPTISLSSMGAALGGSKNAIKGFIDRSADRLPEWKGSPFVPWTAEDEETVRRMWTDGASSAEIARVFKITRTRQSVADKIERMGLPKRSAATVQRGAVTTSRLVAKAAHGLKFGNPVSDVPLLPADVDKTAFQPLPGSTPKTLADTAPLRHDGTSTECHWPVGDGPTLFCGCATERDAEGEPVSRYCAVHVKRNGKMVPKLVLA